MISAHQLCAGVRESVEGEHRLEGVEDELTPLLDLFIISVNSVWKREMDLFSALRAL